MTVQETAQDQEGISAAQEAVLEEAQEAAQDQEEILTDQEEILVDLERCIRLFVVSVDKNVKFHLSQQKVSLSFARNASIKEGSINS